MVERLASCRFLANDTVILACKFFIRKSLLSRVLIKNHQQEDIKILMHTVSSPRLLEEAKNIDPVLSTEGWQTLMTFTRESARE